MHIPYCAAKCPYCDFNSIAGRDAEHQDYVEALICEVRRLPRGPYRTVFIGGGTPTLLSPGLLARFCSAVRDHIDLTPDYEWTCEANPGSADAERFQVLAEHGVNRFSLGIQSTHDHHLKFLGRVHDHRQAEVALDLARSIVPRVSADLIMGLPGQTIAELDADLALYRRHELGHASVYHLTYEPGTEFHARRSRGELADIEADESRRQFIHVWEGLESLGLNLYETSNFSRKGEESRHNLAYWTRRDYQAAGAGAVSTVERKRLTRLKHSGQYIQAIRAGEPAIAKTERLTDAEILREAWMLGLRLANGVSIAELEELGDRSSRWRVRADALIGAGILWEDTGRLGLTKTGRPVQDEVTIYLLP